MIDLLGSDLHPVSETELIRVVPPPEPGKVKEPEVWLRERHSSGIPLTDKSGPPMAQIHMTLATFLDGSWDISEDKVLR